MAVTATVATTPTGAPVAVRAADSRGARVRHWRRRLLAALVVGCVVAAATGVVVYIAAQVTFNRYDAIVSHGSSSVDAAQDARADLLDNAAANASLLVAQTQGARDQANATAEQSWTKFQNDLRRSWQNRTDSINGEFAAFDAADAAQTEYDRGIGAMKAALGANPPRPDEARAAFLGANSVLEQRLLPALSSGLEGVKVEDLGSAYLSTSSVVRAWLAAVGAASVLLVVVILAGYYLTRRMHYLFTLELIGALIVVVAIGAWVGVQLRRADTQSRVMVVDAYNSVAGVRDEIALMSQQHERESIAILDATNAAGHFAAFDAFTLEVEQRLCGDSGCSNSPFLAAGQGDAVDPKIAAAGVAGQFEFGLPRPPLVSNVHFTGEAAALENARKQYRSFLDADKTVRTAVQANTLPAATAQSDVAAKAYQATVAALGQAGGEARGVYDASWHSVESAMTIARWLAAGEVVAALLLARGLWRRRAELYPVHGD